MKIIGLTGGIGSGKTTIVKLFSKFKNVAVYIADVEAKQLMNSSNEIRQKIVKKFGEKAYVDGLLNRKYIAGIVFENKVLLAELNAIVHPEVKKHFQNFVKINSKNKYIIYENAILFESKSDLFCDIIISVYTDVTTRIQRVVSRDKIPEKEVRNRINNQWKDHKKNLLSNYVIFNNEIVETIAQVNKIHNILTLKS